MQKPNISLTILGIFLLAISAILLMLKNEVLSTTTQYLIEDMTEEHGAKNLMLGSSSIQKLGQKNVLNCGPWLNRGIGNSTISTLDRYLNFSKLRLEPSLVVLYAGENDISTGKSATQVFESYKRLVQRLIKNFPDSDIHILAIKLSPQRQRYWDRFKTVNSSLAAHVTELKQVFFHSHAVSNPGFDDSIFQDDGVHLTEQGYSLFTAGINQVCATK